METRTISKEALHRTRRRHNWALQWCMNYEKMQGSGFAFGMVPVIRNCMRLKKNNVNIY